MQYELSNINLPLTNNACWSSLDMPEFIGGKTLLWGGEMFNIDYAYAQPDSYFISAPPTF